jgi:hypothetical protein
VDKRCTEEVIVRRYLVIANQTLGGGPLLALLRELGARPSSFYVLVPASSPHDHAWSDGEAVATAERRLEAALARFRAADLEVDGGEVGDGRPMQAVTDLLDRGERFDEVVLSTLPAGPSRWLRLDIVHRLESFGMPLHHVIGPREPSRV